MTVLLLNLGIEKAALNLGMGFDLVVFVVGAAAGLIFYAKDFKIGLMYTFFVNALLAMWFYNEAWRWTYPLSLMLIAFVILTFTIFTASRVAQKGAVI